MQSSNNRVETLINLGGKAALLFVIIVIVDVAVGAVVSSLIQRGKIDTLSNIEFVQREKPDILVVGSSTAQVGYNSELISKLTGLKTINIGSGGASSAYVYIVTKKILEKHKPMLIIYDNLEEDIIGMFKKDDTVARLAYLYGKDKKINSIISEEIPWSKITLISNIIKYRTIIKNLVRITISIPTDNYHGIKPDNGVSLDYDLAKKNKQEGHRVNTTPIQPDEDSITYRCFDSFVDLCSENQIKLIVVRSPRYPWSNKGNDARALDLAKSMLDQTNAIFKHISLDKYPYFSEKRYYSDVFHVNANGADSISAIVSHVIVDMHNNK